MINFFEESLHGESSISEQSFHGNPVALNAKKAWFNPLTVLNLIFVSFVDHCRHI